MSDVPHFGAFSAIVLFVAVLVAFVVQSTLTQVCNLKIVIDFGTPLMKCIPTSMYKSRLASDSHSFSCEFDTTLSLLPTYHVPWNTSIASYRILRIHAYPPNRMRHKCILILELLANCISTKVI